AVGLVLGRGARCGGAGGPPPRGGAPSPLGRGALPGGRLGGAKMLEPMKTKPRRDIAMAMADLRSRNVDSIAREHAAWADHRRRVERSASRRPPRCALTARGHGVTCRAMSARIDRRAFLARAGAAGPAASGPVAPRRPASAAGDRLVVAVGQWGTETPLAWRSTQAEKPLWDQVYDPLIMRDPRTFGYQPGLATEWKPSNEMRTWTFKLRSGVTFHEGYGEMTSEDVKYPVEQSFKPDAIGGSAYFFRNHLDKIETPDKSTLVMRFKTPQWMV